MTGMNKGQSSTVDVSFVIASHNSVPFLEAAILSALAQQDVRVEVLVIDDGSSDGSDRLARQLAAGDPRIRCFTTPRNLGPGGARNIGITEMRGRWFAVLDSDDLVTPDRSRTLIDAAEAAGADMVADDLEMFGEGMETRRFLEGSPLRGATIDLETYFDQSRLYDKRPNPGFLKPMIARDLLSRSDVHYDERLRVAEDDDLVIRLLLAGARYQVVGSAHYRYRKHAQSISHRLSLDHAERMGAHADRLQTLVRAAGQDSPAFRRRQRSLRDAVAFSRAVDRLKRRQPLAALRAVLARPGSAPLFLLPWKARLHRLAERRRLRVQSNRPEAANEL